MVSRNYFYLITIFCLYTYILSQVTNKDITQSVGAVEYTDCISTEGEDSPNECPVCDIKPYEGKAPAFEIWEMWDTPSLPLILVPLWPGIVALDRILSVRPIEQTVCKQMTDVKLWLLYGNIWNCVQKRDQVFLKILSTKSVYESFIYLIYMFKQDLALNNLIMVDMP